MMWIFFAIIICPIVIYITFKLYFREICVTYIVSPLNWFVLHFMVFSYSFLAITFNSMLTTKLNNITEQPNAIKAWSLLFFQQGGGMIFVMLLSSVMYKFLIEISDLDYSIGYNQTLSKIFFTVICCTCAFAYYYEARVLQKENILDESYGQAVTCLVTGVGIWIGFGLKCDGRLGKKKNSFEFTKENFPYLIYCVVSMFPFPATFMLCLINGGIFPIWVSQINRIIIFQLVVSLIILICLKLFYEPCKLISTIRAKCALLKIIKRKRIKYRGYYQNVTYEISMVDEEIFVSVLPKKIRFKNSLNKQEWEKVKKYYRKRIDNKLTGPQFVEELIKFLDELVEERRDILQTGFRNARLEYIMARGNANEKEGNQSKTKFAGNKDYKELRKRKEKG